MITGKEAPSLGAALDKDPHGYLALVTGVVPLSQRSKSAKYAMLEIWIVTPAELEISRAEESQREAEAQVAAAEALTGAETEKRDQLKTELEIDLDLSFDDDDRCSILKTTMMKLLFPQSRQRKKSKTS